MLEKSKDERIKELEDSLLGIQALAKSIGRKCAEVPQSVEMRFEVESILNICNPKPTIEKVISQIIRQGIAGHIGDDIPDSQLEAFSADVTGRLVELFKQANKTDDSGGQ